ncbi:MAG TPA: YidC/Oxa1 family membrane protein insertase [Candidatus Binatia bacterium]|jgi:YidC/Oxa1 family membrane protein insertase|nr:YidC/Oxa1 family membrane protein insertase [Candidatus Binatia bacterium]
MTHFFQAIFYQPIFNLLIFLYDAIPGHDLGIAIILLTIIIKLVLWPLSNGALRSQKALSDIQPKLDALKKEYEGKEKQEELAKAMMALYSKEKVSPFSSCLPVLIQLPVFIALYRALSHGLKSNGFEMLYPFVTNPGTIVPSLFGFIDLAKPNIALALLAGASQYLQAKMMVTRQQPRKTPGAKDEDMLATMNKQMLYMMPALTVVLGWKLPGGLALYWLLTNLLTVLQQKVYFRNADKGPDAAAAAASKT